MEPRERLVRPLKGMPIVSQLEDEQLHVDMRDRNVLSEQRELERIHTERSST